MAVGELGNGCRRVESWEMATDELSVGDSAVEWGELGVGELVCRRVDL